MAGIGAEGAGGLAALQALLRQRVADQIAAQEREQQAGQREFSNSLRLRDVTAQEDATTFNRERLMKTDADAAKAAADQEGFIAGQPAEVQPVLRGRLMLKMPSLNQHDLEAPDVHQGHLTTEADAKRKQDLSDYESKEKIQAKYRPPQKEAKSAADELALYEAKKRIDAQYTGARPSLGAERSTLGYFNRMLEAERNARRVEDKLGGGDLAAQQYAPGWLENWLQSDEGQQYTQAQRMFTEARLRKESGAAIPQNEFDTDRKTNFRIAGDTPELVKQKRAARITTMRGLGNAAGRALPEFYGEGKSVDELLKEFEESGGQAVAMVAPDGRPLMVPAEKVAEMEAAGAKRR
jgi:hypothetical protein